MARTPFIILYSIISLEMVLFSSGAVLKGWPNNCLVCLCFFTGLSCANIPLYTT